MDSFRGWFNEGVDDIGRGLANDLREVARVIYRDVPLVYLEHVL